MGQAWPSRRLLEPIKRTPFCQHHHGDHSHQRDATRRLWSFQGRFAPWRLFHSQYSPTILCKRPCPPTPGRQTSPTFIFSQAGERGDSRNCREWAECRCMVVCTSCVFVLFGAANYLGIYLPFPPSTFFFFFSFFLQANRIKTPGPKQHQPSVRLHSPLFNQLRSQLCCLIRIPLTRLLERNCIRNNLAIRNRTTLDQYQTRHAREGEMGVILLLLLPLIFINLPHRQRPPSSSSSFRWNGKTAEIEVEWRDTFLLCICGWVFDFQGGIPLRGRVFALHLTFFLIGQEMENGSYGRVVLIDRYNRVGRRPHGTTLKFSLMNSHIVTLWHIDMA